MAHTKPAPTLKNKASDAAALPIGGYRKVTWRLLPFLFFCYMVAYLDRVNVGFAKLRMLSDLKFS